MGSRTPFLSIVAKLTCIIVMINLLIGMSDEQAKPEIIVQYVPESQVRSIYHHDDRFLPQQVYAPRLNTVFDAQTERIVPGAIGNILNRNLHQEYQTPGCPHCFLVVMCEGSLEERKQWSQKHMLRLFFYDVTPEYQLMQPMRTLATIVQAHEDSYCWRIGRWRDMVDELARELVIDEESCTPEAFKKIDTLKWSYRRYLGNIIPLLEWFRVQMFDYCRGHVDMRERLEHSLNQFPPDKLKLLRDFRESSVSEVERIKDTLKTPSLRKLNLVIDRMILDDEDRSRSGTIEEIEDACEEFEQRFEILHMYGNKYVQDYVFGIMDDEERHWFAVKKMCRSILDSMVPEQVGSETI